MDGVRWTARRMHSSVALLRNIMEKQAAIIFLRNQFESNTAEYSSPSSSFLISSTFSPYLRRQVDNQSPPISSTNLQLVGLFLSAAWSPRFLKSCSKSFLGAQRLPRVSSKGTASFFLECCWHTPITRPFPLWFIDYLLLRYPVQICQSYDQPSIFLLEVNSPAAALAGALLKNRSSSSTSPMIQVQSWFQNSEPSGSSLCKYFWVFRWNENKFWDSNLIHTYKTVHSRLSIGSGPDTPSLPI